MIVLIICLLLIVPRFLDFNKYKPTSKRKLYRSLFSRSRKLSDLITSIIQQQSIDVAFIDYLFNGQYIRLLHRLKIPVIYGTHNAQAVLMSQRPAGSFRERMGKLSDFLMHRLHESIYFRKADALLVVSDKDKEYHSAFVKKDKIFVIPNFLDESDYQESSKIKENYIVMTANFNAYQNACGLEWFVKKVWDKDLWSKTKLVLVGLGSKEAFKRLNLNQSTKNIDAIGEVEDLKPYIANALVSVVPLLHGSGSRLKCLEAMALKTQLVSTTKGMEGIEHNNSVVLADKAEDFKQALLSVINKEVDLTERAYQMFVDKYSLTSCKKDFIQVMEGISHSFGT